MGWKKISVFIVLRGFVFFMVSLTLTNSFLYFSYEKKMKISISNVTLILCVSGSQP